MRPLTLFGSLSSSVFGTTNESQLYDMTAKKLHQGEQRMLQLISKESVDGWTGVSDFVLPLVKSLPEELVIIELVPHDTCSNRVKLTPLGERLVEAMQWLS